MSDIDIDTELEELSQLEELDFGQQILRDIQNNEMASEMKLALAQGLLPIEQNILTQALFLLCSDPDPSVAASAQQSLSEMPDALFFGIADSTQSHKPVLHALARLKMASMPLLKKLVVNRACEDQTIEMIARNCHFEDVLGLIVGNQERLLRHPVLFDVLLEHHNLSAFRKSQLEVYREELKLQGRFAPEPPPPAAAPEAIAVPEAPAAPAKKFLDDFDLDLIADFEVGEGGPFTAAQMVPFQAYARSEKANEEQKEMNVYKMLATMNLKDKLKLAMFGSPDARNILVKEGDKKVATAVLKNPKLQESDLEKYAKMKNINSDVLRVMGSTRAWLKNYGIVHSLVQNPRTPVGTSMGLLNLLHDADVKALLKNREVPAALRSLANQKMAKKTEKKSGGGGH